MEEGKEGGERKGLPPILKSYNTPLVAVSGSISLIFLKAVA